MKIYHVDSFTDKLFQGNPAAVCILGEDWLQEDLMIKIAMENNLSETAFVIMKNGIRHIRWFTPKCEVNLCGHATLATAHVLFNHEGVKDTEIIFESRKGTLGVKKQGDYIMLDFPIDEIRQIQFFDEIDCFNAKPVECYIGADDYMLVFESQEQIENLECNMLKASKLSEREGFICTAKGKAADFVSRYFGPKIGILEDPVTGSAHAAMAPYWTGILEKTEFSAMQLSERGGQLICKVEGERVIIGGKAVTYSINKLLLKEQ
ncbi:MAG: PhzF family phenazine biosynthesis protein [Defluviitaleaceae bacterium]|nr:PhzF family phenazine biosynthesis protein [Defluviitaleaceae bacterium]